MKTRTKLFFILLIASIIAVVLALPYIITVQGDVLKQAGVSIQLLVIIAIIQGAIFAAVAIILGLILAEKVGFKLPLLTAWLERKKIKYSKTLTLSIVLGIIVGVIILVLDRFVFLSIVSLNVAVWQGFLASFYGGIVEELIMRLFLVSLFAFIFMKIARKKAPGKIAVWASIVIVSVLFGLGHLPITAAVTSLTSFIIARAIVLNGIGGIVFGWLYWKRGLEAAIIAHFTADIVLHVVGNLI